MSGCGNNVSAHGNPPSTLSQPQVTLVYWGNYWANAGSGERAAYDAAWSDIASVTGRVSGELELPGEENRTDFYFKFLPSPDGKGFDTDPALVYCHRREQTRKLEGVDGEVALRESRFDPVADLPVRQAGPIVLAERSSIQRGEIHGTVPGEWYWTYVMLALFCLLFALTSAGRWLGLDGWLLPRWQARARPGSPAHTILRLL